MRQEHTRIVVCGLGAAGAAIAFRLAECGLNPTALDCQCGQGSSWSNQKWKQAGLLYQKRELAQKMWAAFQHMHPLEKRHLRCAGAHFLAAEEQTLVARRAMWREWDIPFRSLPPQAFYNDSVLGNPRCVGGFHTWDSVIDFPALLSDLHQEAAHLGARMLTGATIRRLVRDGDRVTGVLYEANGEETLLHCDHCIVALGGWAPSLLRPIGVDLPVCNWKSHILTVSGELVGRITAWLDDTRLTLVPYKGTTLIADTRRVAVEEGADRAPDPDAVEALKADLFSCFPSLHPRVLKVVKAHGCIKTECSAQGSRNQDIALFDATCHGVQGLIVVFPGKASLSFVLAQEVMACITPDAQRAVLRAA